jgi:cysteine desulfurase
MKKIYMDYAATTPVDPEVLKAMRPFFSRRYGNASSLHSFGQDARKAVEGAREIVAGMINAEPGEIIFLSGGSEADNLAVKGSVKQGNHMITTAIEHPAVLRACEYLEKNGVEVTYLPVDRDGFVSVQDLKDAMRKETKLVSVMFVNNEIGTIEPIEEIGKICRQKGVLFHTDAVQAFGKIPVDVKKMNIDMLSGSGHKIYGPKGVGFLYVRKGIGLAPLIHGGSQENSRRAGTENAAGIVGLGKACEIAKENMDLEQERIGKLRDYLIENALKIPDTGLNGPRGEGRIYNNANFSFSFIEGEALVMRLDDRGIAASTGSACSSKNLKPSHVLTGIGLTHEQAHGSLRVSLGRHTTREEVDYFLKVLPGIVKDLRRISPLGRK